MCEIGTIVYMFVSHFEYLSHFDNLLQIQIIQRNMSKIF